MLEELTKTELNVAEPENHDAGACRRALLIGAGALVVAGVTGQVVAQNAPWGMGRNIARYWGSVTNRLVRRITYGLTGAESTRASSMGYQAYLDEQLNWAAIDDSACDAYVATHWPLTQKTFAELTTFGGTFAVRDSYVHETIYRAFASKRQLRERMFEFWCDHFNICDNKVRYHQTLSYLRDVIRKNCMSDFGTILRAVANSGAMMSYLDNYANSGTNPNINYARELLELHTFGVDNGYTQADLYQVAKIMSGWSVEDVMGLPTWEAFKYRPEYHVLGDKVTLGRTFKAGQKDEGDELLTFLANHDNTARFICTKLCKFFLDYSPAPTVIDTAVLAWKSSAGDVVTVLRAILTQINVRRARPKLKRPFHYCISALKACPPDMATVEFGSVERVIDAADQWFYKSETPDSYKDRYDYWGPSMGPLINFALGLPTYAVANLYPQVDLQFYFKGATGNDVTTAIEVGIFGFEMSLLDRKAIYRYLARPMDINLVRTAVALSLAAPSFIWY